MAITKEKIQAVVESKGYSFDENENRGMRYLEIGLGDFYEIQTSINAMNRGFIKLLEATEPLAAMPLIRLQLDNQIYLAAELKHPFRVLYKVFREGKQLIDVRIKNKPIVPSAVRAELDEQHGYNLNELYKEYYSFVHPSDSSLQIAEAEHNLRLLSGIDESKQQPDILENLLTYISLTTEAQKKEAETDFKNMFHLNLLLIKIAKKQIALQKAVVWTNAKNRRFYKNVLADKVRMISLELPKE